MKSYRMQMRKKNCFEELKSKNKKKSSTVAFNFDEKSHTQIQKLEAEHGTV